MYFDVPKVVRTPGYDHRHDEESRNGREVKVDILEAYIWTSEWFQVVRAFFRSTGRLPDPPWALLGLSGKEGKGAKEGARPPKPNPNWEGGGPPFLPPSLLLPSSPTPTWKGGILLPEGVGLP